MFIIKSLLTQFSGYLIGNKKELYMKVNPSNFLSIDKSKNSFKPLSIYYDIVLKTKDLEIYNTIDREKSIIYTEIVEMRNDYIKVIYNNNEEYLLYVFVKLKNQYTFSVGLLLLFFGSSFILINQRSFISYIFNSIGTYINFDIKMIGF